MSELLEHVAGNRAYWDDFARQYVEAGERACRHFLRKYANTLENLDANFIV